MVIAVRPAPTPGGSGLSLTRRGNDGRRTAVPLIDRPPAGATRVSVRLQRVRADALPEYTRYTDDGCDIHPHCLTCPLIRCRYDEPGGLRALLNAQRDERVLALRRQGQSVDAIARRFRLSRRTVFRILSGPAGRQGQRPQAPLTLLSPSVQ